MTSCFLCQNRRIIPFVREGEWDYVRCGHCGLVFLHPQPSSSFLLEHYQGYLPANPEGIETWQGLMAKVFDKTAAAIEAEIPAAGHLLDVGCGYGFFLKKMARRGWQVQGIEISATARRFARVELGLDVSAQPLPRPDWPDECFDVITLFYVIEHLPAPVAALREARRLLRPGGLLILRWPHTAPIVRILKPWAARLRLLQAPSHLFDFSPKTLYRILNRLGFGEIRTSICGWTRPGSRGARLAAWLFGSMAEVLARISHDRLLLPGVSKTTVARR